MLYTTEHDAPATSSIARLRDSAYPPVGLPFLTADAAGDSPHSSGTCMHIDAGATGVLSNQVSDPVTVHPDPAGSYPAMLEGRWGGAECMRCRMVVENTMESQNHRVWGL